MKNIIFTILLTVSLNAQPISDYYSGRAGDVLHLTGSKLLCLGINKYTDFEWHKAAATTFALGFTWEVCDEIIGKWVFDPSGFSEKDLLFDAVGVLISYPLRYKKCELKIANRKVSLCIKF